MMKIKALVTTAVMLATSTAALAGPRYSPPSVRDHRAPVDLRATVKVGLRVGYDAGVNVRDQREPSHVSTLPPTPTSAESAWSTIGSFNYGFAGTKSIDLGCEGRVVHTLRIATMDPTAEVTNIVVRFADGTSQTVLWNHSFSNSTDGQTGPYLVMHFNPGTVITRVDVNAPTQSGLAVQIQSA